MKGLRFALLVNSRTLERWHLRCLDHLEQVATLAGVVEVPDRASPLRARSALLTRIYATDVDSTLTSEIAARLAGVPRFDATGVDATIKGQDFDFVLQLGPGEIPAVTESAGRQGVWIFQHERDDDPLPFFREVYEGEDVTRAALLAVHGSGRAPVILEQGYFRTEKRSYVQSRDRVVDSIAEWPARVCRRLSAQDEEGECQAMQTAPPASGLVGRPRVLTFCVRMAARRLAFAWERLFRHRQWNIGVLPVSITTLLSPGGYADGNISWFPLHDRDHFLSDPFATKSAGTIHILCEYFGYRSETGYICSVEYSNGFAQPEPALTLPVHMSYPFIVEHAGETYCVPEISHADEVALFRAVDFPRSWSKVAVLLDNFKGVDPTVFHHDGRWWLMCTEAGVNADVKLWVWHAADLLGPWTPHAQNPVKTDVRGARPGGTPFVHEGVLYRPAQDCSKTYGWRIVIQRVTRLTPTEFAEEPVTVLEASADSPFPLGRHTLAPVGDVILIDGHRTAFVWPALRSFLRIWARHLSAKLRSR